MIDPGTAIERIGEAALVIKLLGPTADYLGAGVQQWTERAAHNVHRVFDNAAQKLGSAIEAEGGVPPRVLKGILDESQFADDALTTEYLGGVLASSRTSGARDDRGASLVALVGRMSTYQLRAHFVMYAAAQRALAGMDINLGMDTARRSKPLFVPLLGFAQALDLTEEEMADLEAITSHVLHGLIREDLIEDHFAFGSSEHLRAQGGGNHDTGLGGIIYRVSALGIELFCAAHGRQGSYLKAFTDPDAHFEIAPAISLGPDFALVESLPVLQTSSD